MLTATQKQKISAFDPSASDAKIARELGLSKKAVRSCRRERRSQQQQRRQRIFKIIALSLPFAFFILLEIGLQIFNYGGHLALFVPKEDLPERLRINERIGARYFAATETLPEVSNDTFLKNKPKNAYRIFVLGGSTTFGYPYAHNGSISKMLGQRLSDYFPEKEIEIVNLGMPAVNSFTLLDLTDEVLAQQPDALIIYAGHNEFYGALGAGSTESLGQWRGFINFYIKMQRFKTVMLFRDGIEKAKSALASAIGENAESNTLMEQMVGNAAIAFNDATYRRGIEFFRENISEIIVRAQKANVRVILADLVSNLRDQPPFVSIYASDEQRRTFEKSISKGQAWEQAGDDTGAIAIYDSLLQVNPHVAILHFRRGKCLEVRGKYNEAYTAYSRARDLDGLRFRASAEMNEAIHALGKAYKVDIAEIEKAFRAALPNGLVGNNLMLEHLHPNVRGYFLMGKALASSLKAGHFIRQDWDASLAQADSAYWQKRGVTELDEEVARIRIGILTNSWPFVPKMQKSVFQYVATTPLQKIAKSCWEREITYEQAHVMMAEQYTKQRLFGKAVREYEALALETPYNDSPFLRAGMLYLTMNRLDLAKEKFLHAIKIQPTAIATKYMGSILIQENKPIRGIPYLERSLILDPADIQARYNLTGAYLLVKNIPKAKKHLTALQASEGSSKRVRDLEISLTQLEQIASNGRAKVEF